MLCPLLRFVIPFMFHLNSFYCYALKFINFFSTNLTCHYYIYILFQTLQKFSLGLKKKKTSVSILNFLKVCNALTAALMSLPDNSVSLLSQGQLIFFPHCGLYFSVCMLGNLSVNTRFL